MIPRPLRMATISWLLLCGLVAGAWCAEGPSGDGDRSGSPPTKFRRVYAPADRIHQWPIGQEEYWPVAPDRFERLVQRASAAGSLSRANRLPRLSRAEYHAQLVGERWLEGRATLSIEHPGPWAALLRLAPCGLAVREASWAGESPTQAKTGTVGDSTLRVLVPQSGRLELGWSLAGSRDASGAVRFALELPPCTVSRLSISLPETVVPEVDRGVVVAEGGASGGTRRWRIELGPHHRVRLHLVSAEAKPRPRRVRLAESSVYDVSQHGLDLAVQWKLEVLNQPLGEIALRLDPGLELVSVRYGDAPVPWSEQEQEGGRRVVVELPKPISGTGRVLHLRALAPIQLERPWTPPRIHPQQVQWQEGTVTLLVSKPLMIRNLAAEGCRQTGAAPLPSPREGESAVFRCYRPDPALALELGRREAPLQVSSGTMIRLGSEEAAAEVLADFHLAEGARFVLEADVAEGWLIDAVQSTPAGLIDSFPIRGRGSERRLEVRLAKGLSASQPVRLRIAARRFHSRQGPPFALEELVPLEFPAAEHGPRLVALEPIGSYSLKTSGADDLRRIEPQSLDDSAAALFSQPPRGLVFEHGSHAAGLQVAILPQRPTYEAELRVEAAVSKSALRESYTFRCVPQGTRMERVLVHFAPGRATPPRFSLATGNEQSLSARRLPAEEQLAVGLPPKEETWELRLRRPRSVPLEIHATREIELGQEQPISLAALPEAGNQQGWLVIRSPEGEPLEIVNRRLEPVPAETLPFGQVPTVRAAYRYNPVRDTIGIATAAVSVATNGESTTARACVWSCHLESRYQADGAARHLAIYRIQGTGRGALRLVLPPGASLEDVHGAWVDAERVQFRRSAGGLSVPLPHGRRFPTVAVDFSTSPVSLGLWGELEPPMPVADLPVLAAQWTVWLPPGFEECGRKCLGQSDVATRLSWTQRLFGPLGRPAGATAFDPASAGDWLQWSRSRSKRRRDLQRAERWQQALGSLSGEGDPSGRPAPASWAELLGHRSIEDIAATLLVDRPALARLGIGPASSLPRPDGQTASERGGRLLEEAELALLLSDEAVVLTSRRKALLDQAHLAPLGRTGVYQVAPGPLAEQIGDVASGGPEGWLASLETWVSPPGDPPGYWNATGFPGFRASDNRGWKVCRLEIPIAEPERVGLEYIHTPRVQALAWVGLLLAIGLGWCVAAGRPLWLLASVGILGSLSLLLPEAYVPITACVVLGTLFCLARELVRREPPAGAAVEARTPAAVLVGPPSTSTQVLLWLVMVALGTFVLLSTARGQGPEVSPQAPASDVPRVFIPVDQDLQPTGGRYQVPKALYRELLRRAEAAESPHGWLIGSAVYRGGLTRGVGSERYVVEELRGSYQLRAFEPGVTVRLPLRRDEANLVPDGVLLDGVAIRPEWEASGEALTFQVPEPGPYHLEVVLRPTMRSGLGRDGFDLSIPPSATSRLELSLPAGAPAVEVPEATGLVRVEEDPSRLVAEMGAVDRLSVFWPEGAAAPAGGRPALEVEELLWLKVQPDPGTTVMDVKLKLSLPGGEIRQLRLAADPRLRLLELRGENRPKAETKTSPDQDTVIELRWPEPVAQTTVVEASLLVGQSPGVGRLSLPRFEVLDARSARRWLAVSLGPVLERVEEEGSATDSLAVSQFMAAWGKADAAAQFAYGLGSDGPPWSIATRPRDPQTDVRKTVALSFDDGFAEVRLDAGLDTTGGYHFQHRVELPPDFEVEGISVREEEVERVARWSIDSKGRLVVFFTGPVAGPHRLALRGRWRTVGLKQVQLPRFSIDGARLQSSTVDIYRRPAALVVPVQIDPAVEIERAAGSPDDRQLGRLVARLRSGGGEPVRAALSLAPNRPSVRGDQLVRLIPGEGGSWTAELDCRVEVDNGLLDEIVLDVSPVLAGPFRVTADPPAELAVTERPDGRRRLVLRPPSAIAAGYQFRLSSPLSPERGSRPEAPRVAWVGTEELRRLVSLPMRDGERSLGWETRGLRPTPLPDGFVPPAGAGEFATFEAIGEPYEAVLRSAPPGSQRPRVTLADVHLAWWADGSVYGVAAFDVQPGTATSCPLHLPAGYHLISVTVAGVPITPSRSGPNRYDLPLGPKWLAQRVEVVFRGALPLRPGAGRQRFEAPWLSDLFVEQTLWTVSGPPEFEPEGPAGADPRSRWRHDLLRLRTTAQLIEAAAGTEMDPVSTPHWYRRWARRLAATRAALLRELNARGGPIQAQAGQAVQAAIREVDQSQSLLAARLETSQVLADCYADPWAAAGPAELWRQTLPHGRGVARYGFHEAAPSLSTGYHRTQSDSIVYRVLGAFALLLGVAGAGWLLHRGLLRRWFAQWPALFGVAIGLAWWLWLSPSVLGWGIVLGSLGAALLSARRRSTPPPGSSVIALRSLRSRPATENY